LASTVSLAHHLALALSVARVADHLGADSLAVVDHRSLPFWYRELEHAGVAAVVVAVVFHTHHCAAEVAGSCRANLEGGLG
jgi:hypothetical protein